MPKAIGTQKERLAKIELVEKEIISRGQVERKELVALLMRNYGVKIERANEYIDVVVAFGSAKEEGEFLIAKDKKHLTPEEQAILKAVDANGTEKKEILPEVPVETNTLRQEKP